MKPRVTIREIAVKAGLHFTTVSLALRNSPRLKSATRLKIQKLAQKMGYVPDPMLAALNAYRQTRQPVHYQAAIAWIHNWPDPKDLYGSEAFKQYYQGACERAKQRGYLIEEFWMREPGMSVEKLHRILRARNIQGALIAPQPEAGMFLDLRYEKLSAVAFGHSMRPAVLDVITNHQIHTMNLLLENILKLGYRRIGLCIPRSWNAKVENAFQSCLLLFQEERPDLPRIPIYWDTWGGNYQADKLVAWVNRHRIEAVISFDNVLQALLSSGFQVPEDLGFASPFLSQTETYLSGVHQNDRLIGRKAVDMVIDMLHSGETGIPESPVRVLVEGVWHPGKTLRNLNPAQAAGTTRKRPALKPKP